MKTSPVTPRFLFLFSALVLTSVAVYAADAPAAALDPVANPSGRPNTAIIPVPQTPADGGGISAGQAQTYMRLHNGFVEQAKQGGIDVLFVGDSITQGWPSTGKVVWDYFYANYPTIKFAEFGIGYDRTQHVLWRLQNGEAQPTLKPKVVELLIGTNNIGSDRNTDAETVVGMKAVVAELRKDFPEAKILVLGIFPRNTPDSSDRKSVNAINAEVAKMDDGKNVFYLDIGSQFIEADGTLINGITTDGTLHPNAQGYLRWVNATTGKLNDLLKGTGLVYNQPAGIPAGLPMFPSETKTLGDALKDLLIKADPSTKAIFDKYPAFSPVGGAAAPGGAGRGGRGAAPAAAPVAPAAQQ